MLIRSVNLGKNVMKNVLKTNWSLEGGRETEAIHIHLSKFNLDFSNSKVDNAALHNNQLEWQFQIGVVKQCMACWEETTSDIFKRDNSI